MIRATIGILAGTGRKLVALAATGVGETSFTANWEAFDGAVYYLLDVSKQEDFSTFVYENEVINAPTTSYVVIGLEDNTTYYYRLRASTEPLYLLDEWQYPGSASAYSLRKLKHDYKGSAIRVRVDTTGQPTYDIGFVDGELDVTTLEGYCTGGLDAYVTKWYDQSGNGNDATQSTDANQPQIVSSGSVILENSKPTIEFDGTDDVLSLASNLSVGSNTTIIALATTASNTLYWRRGSFNYWYLEASQSFRYRNGDFNQLWSSSDGVPIMNNIQKLIATYKTSNSVLLSIDGSDISTKVSGTGTDGAFNNIGSDVLPLNGYFQELIVYSSDQSSNRTGIETNINDFYSIYYVAVNSEYQDILDYADSQGYQRPSYAQCALQDALVSDLKDAGVWSKLDIFYVFATDGDSDFASINWKDPNNHEITEVNSPTFTTNKGWSTDGTSSYINTNYNFATDSNHYTQNDAGIFLGFSEMDTSGYLGDAFCGTLTTSRFTTIRVDQNALSSANRLWLNQSAQSNAMFNSKGDNHIYFGNRTSSTNINSRTTQLSTNTTDTQTATETSIALTNDTLALLGWSSGFMNSLHKMSIFGLSSNLSSTEMDDICTAYYTNYFSNL